MGRHTAQQTTRTRYIEAAGRAAYDYYTAQARRDAIEDHGLVVVPDIAGADDDLTLAPDTTEVLD